MEKGSFIVLMLFRKRVQLAHLDKSLSYSLESIYFWFLTGKSSWVYSRTQGSIPLVVADDHMFYGYCSTCFYPVWWSSWIMGVIFSSILPMLLLWYYDHYLALYLNEVFACVF
jgi:hypothetical protein